MVFSRDSDGEAPMKSRLRMTGVALLAAMAVATDAAAEANFQKLSGGQIRAKVAGMELSDGVHWRDVYERNGTVSSMSMGSKRSGKWRIEKDQFCIAFEKEPLPKCYDVWLSGKQVELRREGLLPLQGVLEPPSAGKH
jgi:hypothetical protein